jgi:hypothetical protein
MRETFANQYLPDIPAADRQHSTKPAVIATAGTFIPWPAGARHPRQAGTAGADKAAQALGSLLSALALVIAACFVSALRGVKTD